MEREAVEGQQQEEGSSIDDGGLSDQLVGLGVRESAAVGSAAGSCGIGGTSGADASIRGAASAAAVAVASTVVPAAAAVVGVGVEVAGATASSSPPTMAGGRLDIRDLSWPDREQVLRVLFSKVHAQREQLYYSQLPEHMSGRMAGGLGSSAGGKLGGGGNMVAGTVGASRVGSHAAGKVGKLGSGLVDTVAMASA